MIYQEDRPTYEDQVPELANGPLMRQSAIRERDVLEAIKQEFI